MVISFSMLCNSAMVYKALGLDEDRNPEFDEGTELNRVYISFNHAESLGSIGQAPASSGTLYYDVQNSLPLGFVFNKGDKIEIDNESYTVLSIHPYYNNAGLRHYEVEFK